MAMVCPQCGMTFERCIQCSDCKVRLVFQQPAKDAPAAWHRSRWMHTPTGRVIFGVLLAQGLFCALRYLFTGVMLMIEGDDPARQSSRSFHALLFLQVLQLLGPVVGGALAGSAQRNGSLLGSLVGAANAMLELLLWASPAQSHTTVALYGLPLLQTLFGALGGWVGSTIWKPPQVVSLVREEKKAAVAKPEVPVFAGPVAWTRVSIGTVLAVMGSLFAGKIFEKVLAASDGYLETAYALQDQIVTWEIRAFAIMFGAGFAGANTFNGFKQGLWVGIMSSVILGGISASQSAGTIVLLTLASSMLLSLAGGWFGCQLLPPVVNKGRSKRDLGPVG